MMKKILFAAIALLLSTNTLFAAWSFSGGDDNAAYMYFDNSVTQWHDVNIYLIIGKSSYSSVYKMTIDATNPDYYFCKLPGSGWTDAEYMAVIGNRKWEKGNFGYSTLSAATYYSGAYTAGLTATAKQKYKLTPASAENGAALRLDWVQNDFEISFPTEAKNNCYLLDEEKQLVTFIFSISNKRFNKAKSDIKEVYAYGSISAWNNKDEDYRLGVYSNDGCFFTTLSWSAIERPGNSGQPEFLFHIFETNDSDYTMRSHSSWEGGIDSRLIFINNGENMMVKYPNDSWEDLAARKAFAQYIRPLSEFDLNDPIDQAKISNFRCVPWTQHLYRSYHPYKPDRARYDTEHARMQMIEQLATAAGINCDIALSGNETSHVGETYTCANVDYMITIPAYYQAIINNNRVLYVGTENGHTPDFNNAIYHSDGERFGQWIAEIIRYINDDNHPVPFQIHCSLGADRTGMICATLAALCGASWEEIAADYESTSNLQIQEFRHRNVVRYCLRNMTGTDPSEATDLQALVAQHFVDGGYLTQAEIDTAVAKLQGQTIQTDIPSVDKPTYQQCYDILGRPVTNTNTHRIYITAEGKKVLK